MGLLKKLKKRITHPLSTAKKTTKFAIKKTLHPVSTTKQALNLAKKSTIGVTKKHIKVAKGSIDRPFKPFAVHKEALGKGKKKATLDGDISKERNKRKLTAAKARSGFKFRNPKEVSTKSNLSKKDARRSRNLAGRKSPFAKKIIERRK